MDSHSHRRKGGKRKERHCSHDKRNSGLENAPISGDSSDESKGKRRRHTKTHDRSAKEKRHQRHLRHSSGGTSAGDSGVKTRHVVSETISSEDYFKRSAEFRAWLSEKRGLTFSDMTSDESRRMFKKFVRHWNTGKLDVDSYGGVTPAGLTHDSQTQYHWKLHSVYEKEVSHVAHKVGQWTNDSCANVGQGSSHDGVTQGLIGPTLPPAVQSDQEVESTEGEDTMDQERERLRLERKAFWKDQETVLDDLLPRESGRERRIEKKKIRYELQKEREVSPDLRDSFSAESSSFDVRAKLQKVKEQRERRTHIAKDKVSEYHAKERARAQAIMELARASKKEGALWR